jgi:hypothetical protein
MNKNTPKLTTEETRRLQGYLSEQTANLARADELLAEGNLTEDEYRPLIREVTRAVILRAAITSMLEMHGTAENKFISYKSKKEDSDGESRV